MTETEARRRAGPGGRRPPTTAGGRGRRRPRRVLQGRLRPGAPTTRLATLVLVLTVALAGCDFLDDVKELVQSLVAGGISFNSNGNLDVGGQRVLTRGMTAQVYEAKSVEASKKIEEATDEEIARFVLERGAPIAAEVTGPTSDEVTNLDKQLKPEFPGGPQNRCPQYPDCPEVPNYKNYPKLGAGNPNLRTIYQQYPKQGRLPDGHTSVQYSTWAGVDLGRGIENPQLYQVGAKVEIEVEGGEVTSVALTPEVRGIPSPADALKGTSFAGVVFKNENFSPIPPKDDDKDGNWYGGQVRTEVKSEAEVFGVSPFSQEMEVQVNVVDGVVYFIATAPAVASLVPQGWFAQLLDAWSQGLKVCNQPGAACGGP